MKKVLIENWSVVNNLSDPWLAPELRGISLVGNVYGHATKPDGSKVKTSRINFVNGLIVNTMYSIYELGQPDSEYLKWLKSDGKDYDPLNPIKMIVKSIY